LASATR